MRYLVKWLLWIALPWSAFAGAGNILVVESYHQEYPWDASYIRGLEAQLGNLHQLDYFQMNTKRLPKSAFQQRADAAWARIKAQQPQLVILGDDNALKFLGPRLAKTRIPVVYLGINRNPRDYLPANSVNFTGVLERPLFKRSIVTVSKILQPKPENILVLFDSGTTSKSAVAETFNGRTQISVFGIGADLRLIGGWDDWRQQVKTARQQGYDAIIVGLYHTLRDSEGEHIAASEALSWTRDNTPVPLFGFWDFAVGGEKTAGGLVLSGEEQGRMAATIAERILAGTPPRKIYPKVARKGRYLFSESQAKRLKLQIPDRILSRTSWTD